MQEETVVIREQVGTGGSSTVYRGSLSPDQTDVAVKIVKKDTSTERGRKVITRTLNEAQLMRQLRHKNICGVIGQLETDTNIFLVMEYASNGDLLDRLNTEGPIEENEAKRIFLQVLQAVKYMHQKGIVHRDIKPENIFFDAKNQVLLGDFGFATRWSPLQSLEEYVGTLNYAAPEIVTHTPYTGPELDMWGLGALLLAMLTARIPFDAGSEELVAQKITKAKYKLPAGTSEGVQDLIRKLLQPNPLKRATLLDVLTHPWFKTSNKPRRGSIVRIEGPGQKKMRQEIPEA